MSATDELRHMLDERCVEHEDKHTELVPGISEWDSTWWRGIAGMEFHAVSDETCEREGCIYINGTYLTPEQAIAATLENGTCELEETDSYPSENGWVHVLECSNCGKECEHVNGDYEYCPHCLAKNKLF